MSQIWQTTEAQSESVSIPLVDNEAPPVHSPAAHRRCDSKPAAPRTHTTYTPPCGHGIKSLLSMKLPLLYFVSYWLIIFVTLFVRNEYFYVAFWFILCNVIITLRVLKKHKTRTYHYCDIDDFEPCISVMHKNMNHILNLRTRIYADFCWTQLTKNRRGSLVEIEHKYKQYMNDYCFVNRVNRALDLDIFHKANANYAAINGVCFRLALKISVDAANLPRYEQWKQSTKQKLYAIKHKHGVATTQWEHETFVHAPEVRKTPPSTLNANRDAEQFVHRMHGQTVYVYFWKKGSFYLQSTAIKLVLSALLGIPFFFHPTYFHLFASLLTGREYLVHDEVEIVKQVTEIETVRQCIVRGFVQMECDELQIAWMPPEIVAICDRFVDESVVPNQVHLERDLVHRRMYRNGHRLF